MTSDLGNFQNHIMDIVPDKNQEHPQIPRDFWDYKRELDGN